VRRIPRLPLRGPFHRFAVERVVDRPNRPSCLDDAGAASYDLESLRATPSLPLSLSLSPSLSFSPFFENLLETGRGSANAESGSVRIHTLRTRAYTCVRVFGYCYVVWTAVLFYWLAFRRGTTRAIIEPSSPSSLDGASEKSAASLHTESRHPRQRGGQRFAVQARIDELIRCRPCQTVMECAYGRLERFTVTRRNRSVNVR